MDHVRELDAAGLRGLVFDIDDTVTRNGVLEAVAFSAMHRLAEAGYDLIAVTGRPLGWVDVIARQWPVRCAVGENGAGWSWVEGGLLREGYFDSERERSAQRELLNRIRDAVSAELPQVRVTADDRARRCDLAFDVGESVVLPRDEVDQLVALIEGHGAHTSVSTVHAHASPGLWNKAVGVTRAMKQVLGVDLDSEIERWAFVGDSGNDAEAFAHFPNSVGVANVREHLDRLPVPPRYATDADRGRGFAELVAHLLNARG